MLKTLTYWRRGIRLYIGLGVALVTLEVWWWASASYSGSLLFATRMEEVFAWLALAMICMAVSIGPVYSIWPRLYGKRIMSDARRLIGVGGAWFASLHILIAYISLFKVANPLSLPVNYQRSFLLGSVGAVVLLAMAFTSFDRAFKGMGIWWFRLHRFVYLALVVILLHAFIIGVHATDLPVLIGLTVVAVSLLAMHSYIAFIRSKRPTIWQILAIGGTGVLLVLVFWYGYGHRVHP
jgi:DMSO/TMAO reductase YedYZ heme-binding membrane subunit